MGEAGVVTRLAAAALTAWTAVAAAAPGIAGSPGFGVVARRTSAAADVERLLEADLRGEAFALLRASGFGFDRSERAAWVVRAPGGDLAWRPWPWDRRYLQSRWLGPAPPGAFAIVHTHPAVVDPKPSAKDLETAAELGVAVYTVSRSGIWRAEPGGGVTRVGDEGWWAGCGAGNHCRESAGPRGVLATAEKKARSETAARALRITE